MIACASGPCCGIFSDSTLPALHRAYASRAVSVSVALLFLPYSFDASQCDVFQCCKLLCAKLPWLPGHVSNLTQLTILKLTVHVWGCSTVFDSL